MPGKRKREAGNASEGLNNRSGITACKPISAIAAARLKAEAAQPKPDGTGEDLPAAADSVDSDIADSEPEEPSNIVAQNFTLCSWRQDGSNVLSNAETELIISLEKHATLSFVGCCIVTVLKGAININGANLSTSASQDKTTREHRVFATSLQPLFKIRGLDRSNHISLLHCTEPSPLAKLSPLFSGIWAASAAGNRSFQVIYQSDADPLSRPLTPEIVPEDWLRSIETIASTPSSTLVTGAPGSGKSTFARRLLNRYLTGLGRSAKAVPAVCFLDLDWSDPEYTPHGQISLTLVRDANLGPSFVHPVASTGLCGNRIIAAHPVPIRSSVDYEEYIITCISSLVADYHNLPQEDSAPPLLINTGGSLYTSHTALMHNILASLKPMHVVHLGEIEAIDSELVLKLDDLQVQCKRINATFHELKAQYPPFLPPRTKEERRSMSMQSYFHQEPSTRGKAKWDVRPLSHFIPWEFCYEETFSRSQDLVGILPLFEPLPPTQLLTALNGSIVYIIETECPSTQALYQALPKTPLHSIPYFTANGTTRKTNPLDPQTSRLVCAALIRGIDLESKTFQVVVPEACADLLYSLTPEKTVLVAGCCETPDWAYTENAYHQLHMRAEGASIGPRVPGSATMMEEIEPSPWVERKSLMDNMGYLNAVRRVRRFLG